MNLQQQIVAFENDFPAAFLDAVKTWFGVMYYDESNPTSHDSNHAVIENFAELDRSLDEIKRFYRNKGLTPRIYDSRAEAPANLFERLGQAGFQVTESERERFLIWCAPCRIETERRLEFRKVTEPDRMLVESVYDEDFQNEGQQGKIRNLNYFRKFTSCPDAHLLFGYLDGVPVTAASLQFDKSGFARVDSVETGTAFRRRGFARESIRNLVRRFSEQDRAEVLYLYSRNPEAIRIYREAGFREIGGISPGWSAEATED